LIEWRQVHGATERLPELVAGLTLRQKVQRAAGVEATDTPILVEA
jgi:hypothetical protein